MNHVSPIQSEPTAKVLFWTRVSRILEEGLQLNHRYVEDSSCDVTELSASPKIKTIESHNN